jgi:inorganic pyrophosphatase
MNKTAEITQIQNFETIPLQQFTPQLEQQFQPEQVIEQPKVEIKKKKEIRVVKHIKYRGLSISIETISGDFRIGYNRGGKWKKRYLVHYGFIPKTEGNDGEDVDVYLKPGANKNADVYVVHQMKNKDGIRSFDEDKIMLGFDSLYEARSVYLQHMPEKYFGGIKKLSFNEFISEYLEPLKKEAEEIIKKAFCNCENTCCTKEAENKNADIVKRIPAMMQKLPNELFSKIKLKSSLQ